MGVNGSKLRRWRNSYPPARCWWRPAWRRPAARRSPTPDVRRVGETLRCMCGCSYTVTSCNMLNCSGAEPARAKLLELVRKGLSDEAIREEFVKIHGRVVLIKPPSDGFNLVGWMMPFAATAPVWPWSSG